MNDLRVANGLGLFSIGLGLTQLAAPDWLAEKTGFHDGRRFRTGGRMTREVIRSLGVRELLSGLLTRRRPAAGLWARVAGDGMDIALLAYELNRNARKERLARALAMVVGITVLDLIFARRFSNRTAWAT
jgi:hypothetical protein